MGAAVVPLPHILPGQRTVVRAGRPRLPWRGRGWAPPATRPRCMSHEKCTICGQRKPRESHSSPSGVKAGLRGTSAVSRAGPRLAGGSGEVCADRCGRGARRDGCLRNGGLNHRCPASSLEAVLCHPRVRCPLEHSDVFDASRRHSEWARTRPRGTSRRRTVSSPSSTIQTRAATRPPSVPSSPPPPPSRLTMPHATPSVPAVQGPHQGLRNPFGFREARAL